LTVESDRDLVGLKRVGRVVALALAEMKQSVEPGMTTRELDEVGLRVFEEHGARSAPQLVYGAPCVNFIGIDDEAVHALPGGRPIEPGDLVKIDVTAELDGYIADSAATVVVPPVEPVKERLKECAEAAFSRAAAVARAGRPINKIGRVLEAEVRRRGFEVLRELNSHGVGRNIHEEPSVPQYYDPRFGAPLTKGLVITIEPIVSAGSAWTVDGSDGWTIKTADGSPSAHHEHTIVVTKGSPIVLTAA
jgi:methionyl aminopeptidase